MSQPFAPANNAARMPPPGQTKKSLGAERIPQSTDIPRPNPGSVQTKIANRAGVDPMRVTQRPGYTPPVGMPAARPAPVAAAPLAALPPAGQVPLPQPRPPQGGMGDTFAAAPDALRQALAQRMGAPQGLPATGSGNPPPPMTMDPFTDDSGNPVPRNATPYQIQQAGLDPSFVMRARNFDLGRQALARAMAAGAQQGPGPRDVPKGSPNAVPPPAPSGNAPSAAAPPPAAAGPAGPPSGGFKPSQGTEPYFIADPNAQYKEGKKGKKELKDVPLKSAKAEKGHSLYYYRTLGVDPSEGKTAANAALQKLIARAKAHPETITRDEDRLLATAGGDPAFYKPMDEASIRGRFREYQAQAEAAEKGEGGQTSIAKSGSFDPASTAVQDVLANRGAPVWEGNRHPTQADVNQRAANPEAFKQQFPSYTQPAAPPPQQSESDDEEEDK